MENEVDYRHVTYMANGNLEDAQTVTGNNVYAVTQFGIVIFQSFDNHRKTKKVLIPWQWVIELGWWSNDTIGHKIVPTKVEWPRKH